MNIRALSLISVLAVCCPASHAQRSVSPKPEAAAAAANEEKAAVALPAPPFAATVAKDPEAASRKFPKLKQLSAKANSITDDAKWMEANNVPLVFVEVPNPAMQRKGALPETVPATDGTLMAVRAFRDADHGYVIYGTDFSSGTLLTLWDTGFTAKTGAYDFSAWTKAPVTAAGEDEFVFQQITFAAISEGILYVSHGHSTYAKSSAGKNAWLSAIRMADDTLLWRSAPLVSNCANFILTGDAIISGYGFTAEDDFLFLINRHTGATVSKLKVKSGPSLLSLQEKTLLVRTYNTDYKFALGELEAGK